MLSLSLWQLDFFHLFDGLSTALNPDTYGGCYISWRLLHLRGILIHYYLLWLRPYYSVDVHVWFMLWIFTDLRILIQIFQATLHRSNYRCLWWEVCFNGRVRVLSVVSSMQRFDVHLLHVRIELTIIWSPWCWGIVELFQLDWIWFVSFLNLNLVLRGDLLCLWCFLWSLFLLFILLFLSECFDWCFHLFTKWVESIEVCWFKIQTFYFLTNI